MSTLEHVDLLSAEAVADPYPTFALLREHDPVHWSEKYRSWFVTRFDDVAAALRDERFSSDRISPYRKAKLDGPDADPAVRSAVGVLEDWMVFKDPPDHIRLRKLLTRAFTPRAVGKMRPRVAELVDELLDAALDRDGEVDLIADFAYPLTASVIAEMLGVPRADRGLFKDWSDQITGLVFGGMGDPNRHTVGAQGMAELTDYLAALVAEHERVPADDLLTALINARDAGETLSHQEVISTGVLLLFAGHETTTNLIGNGMLAFLQFPRQRALLENDPSLIGDAVEELLRYEGPAKTVVRLMAEDVELHRRTLRCGDRVFLCAASANRDQAVFEDPDQLDITRREGRQLGFGLGIHFCLGAQLARLEAAVAIPRALQRMPELQTVHSELEWQPVLLSRGLRRFPVRV